MNIRKKVNKFKADMHHKISCTTKDIYCWCVNNKDVVIFLAPLIIGTSTKLINRSFKKRDLKLEQRAKELYVYDRSAGRYLKLRRPMKQGEQIKFDALKRSGKTTTEALMNLKLL